MRLLMTFALLGSAIAVPKSTGRIVGGEETTIETYPFMSNMQYNLYNIWWIPTCGGVVLTSTILLSAAHCYEGDSTTQWRAILGSTRASGDGSVHRVNRFIIHEQYNSPVQANDIALVQLSDRAVYSPSIQAARIPGATFNLPDGTALQAVGWGALYNGGNYPDRLRHVELNLVNQSECAARYVHLKTQHGYGQWPNVTDGMICAGILDVGGKDACSGDDGGPLVYQDMIIIGIFSWSYQCADRYYPGVSTRVSTYSNWIVENNV